MAWKDNRLLKRAAPRGSTSKGADLFTGLARPRNLMFLAAMPLAGCSPAGAPSLFFFGAYFPSWLACAFIAILATIVIRMLFVRLGIDDVLPARLPVYVCIAASIGFLISLIGFGR